MRDQSNDTCWGSSCANTFPIDKLYSSSISKLYLNANKDGVFARTACRHFGSPSWEITRVSSWAEMASNKTGSSSYSSGEVKWSFKQRISVSKWDKNDIVLCLARLRNIEDLNISGFVLVSHELQSSRSHVTSILPSHWMFVWFRFQGLRRCPGF